MELPLEYLKNMASLLGLWGTRPICNVVIDDPRFAESPGGSEYHHAYRGGLVVHVAEVMHNAFKLSAERPSGQLVTAVVWHDYMKVRDYSLQEVAASHVEEVRKMPYRKLINHVAGSYGEWVYHARLQGLGRECIDGVGHLLLSHHGRRDWGSPVEPLTRDAFILHTADMMSSRGCNF